MKIPVLLKEAGIIVFITLLIIGFIFFIIPSLFFILGKLFGIILILFGFLIIKEFPDMFQGGSMTRAGILLGLILLLIGLYLLVF